MNAFRCCLISLLVFVTQLPDHAWSAEVVTDQSRANKLFHDLHVMAKAKPDSRDYVFSVAYMGQGNPGIDCAYVVVVGGGGIDSKIKTTQRTIFVLEGDSSANAVDSFKADMGLLATSGSYDSLAYVSERFGPTNLKTYKFDFMRHDGSKIMTRWFDRGNGHEVGVASYGSGKEVTYFRFHVRPNSEDGKIEDSAFGTELSYQSIPKEILSGKGKKERNLRNLDEVQEFAVRLLKLVREGGDKHGDEGDHHGHDK